MTLTENRFRSLVAIAKIFMELIENEDILTL